MKKILAMIITGIIALSLVSCGGGPADEKFVGKWISVAGESLGITLTGEDIDGFELNLESGGKGTMVIDEDEGKIKWTNDETTLTITVDGEEMVATIGEDTLVFDDMLGMGMKITFALEGSDAANPENYLPEEVKSMIGTWNSYNVTDVLGDDASAEISPEALKLTFKADYTVDVEYNGESIPGQTWSMLGDWGSLDDSDYSISWDVVGEEIEVTYSYGEDYFIFSCKK